MRKRWRSWPWSFSASRLLWQDSDASGAASLSGQRESERTEGRKQPKRKLCVLTAFCLLPSVLLIPQSVLAHATQQHLTLVNDALQFPFRPQALRRTRHDAQFVEFHLTVLPEVGEALAQVGEHVSFKLVLRGECLRLDVQFDHVAPPIR